MNPDTTWTLATIPTLATLAKSWHSTMKPVRPAILEATLCTGALWGRYVRMSCSHPRRVRETQTIALQTLEESTDTIQIPSSWNDLIKIPNNWQAWLDNSTVFSVFWRTTCNVDLYHDLAVYYFVGSRWIVDFAWSTLQVFMAFIKSISTSSTSRSAIRPCTP